MEASVFKSQAMELSHSTRPHRDNMYEFECGYCDLVIEAKTVKPVKTEATTHLEDNHSNDVDVVLQNRCSGVSCHNNCGYVFPVSVEEVTGLDCPECGSDNRTPLLRRHVFWKISAK